MQIWPFNAFLVVSSFANVHEASDLASVPRRLLPRSASLSRTHSSMPICAHLSSCLSACFMASPPFIAIECRIPRYDTYRVTPPPKKLHSASHSITVSKALDSRRLWPMRLSSLSHLLSSPRKPTPSSSFVAERGLTMPLTRYHLHEDQPQLCVCERI